LALSFPADGAESRLIGAASRCREQRTGWKSKNSAPLHYGDLTDGTSLIRIIQEVRPTEIYNLAALSHVQVSFEAAEYTANADAPTPSSMLGPYSGED
jgi:GDP-D-mannose dehydratase